MADRLNQKLKEYLGETFYIKAAPASSEEPVKYALYLSHQQATPAQQPGVWLGMDVAEAEKAIRSGNLEAMWAEWVESCERYATSPNPDMILAGEVDYAIKTWGDYVRSEVPPQNQAAMSKPTAQNILFRLKEKRVCPPLATVEQIEAILDGRWLTPGEAGVLFDVPVTTIRSTIQAGHIKRVARTGRKMLRFPQWAFKEWLANRPERGRPLSRRKRGSPSDN